MKKNKSTIILILVFFVGLSVMLYPTLSDYVNQRHQSRAVATYAADVDKLTNADSAPILTPQTPLTPRSPPTRTPCTTRTASPATKARWT